MSGITHEQIIKVLNTYHIEKHPKNNFNYNFSQYKKLLKNLGYTGDIYNYNSVKEFHNRLNKQKREFYPERTFNDEYYVIDNEKITEFESEINNEVKDQKFTEEYLNDMNPPDISNDDNYINQLEKISNENLEKIVRQNISRKSKVNKIFENLDNNPFGYKLDLSQFETNDLPLVGEKLKEFYHKHISSQSLDTHILIHYKINRPLCI